MPQSFITLDSKTDMCITQPMQMEDTMMDIVRWNPWNEMNALRRRFNHVFNAPVFGFESADSAENEVWRPRVDIVDGENQITINAELPGLKKEDIHIDVKDGILTLTGERSEEKEVKEARYYRRERVSGTFQRSFSLPEGLNTETIAAEYKDGVLSVAIPKPEASKPRQISVH